jgi:hypothetical protein
VGGVPDSQVTLASNEYYIPDGQAMILCGKERYSLKEVQEKFELEKGSTMARLPTEDTILDWATAMIEHKDPLLV